MTATLRWSLVEEHKGSLDGDLRRALGDYHFGSSLWACDLVVGASDIPYLKGLAYSGGMESAVELIKLIEEHGQIKLSTTF